MSSVSSFTVHLYRQVGVELFTPYRISVKNGETVRSSLEANTELMEEAGDLSLYKAIGPDGERIDFGNPAPLADQIISLKKQRKPRTSKGKITGSSPARGQRMPDYEDEVVLSETKEAIGTRQSPTGTRVKTESKTDPTSSTIVLETQQLQKLAVAGGHGGHEPSLLGVSAPAADGACDCFRACLPITILKDRIAYASGVLNISPGVLEEAILRPELLPQAIRRPELLPDAAAVPFASDSARHVLIVTAIGEEFGIVRDFLNQVEPNKAERLERKVWERGDILRWKLRVDANCDVVLSLALVNDMGNVSMSVLGSLIETVQTRNVVLVGIAGAVNNIDPESKEPQRFKIRVGDVVIAKAVKELDFSIDDVSNPEQLFSPDGVTVRMSFSRKSVESKTDFAMDASIMTAFPEWLKLLTPSSDGVALIATDPDVHTDGVIGAGPVVKFIAFQKYLLIGEPTLFAVSCEDGGFARLLNSLNLSWLIVRGISDPSWGPADKAMEDAGEQFRAVACGNAVRTALHVIEQWAKQE